MKTKFTHHLLAALLGVAPLRRQVLPILLMWLVAVCNANATLYSVELIDNDGPHITGIVDTVANTFTIQTWTENPGGTAFWSANDLPRTYQAKQSGGSAYDVPDNWNGTMIGWGFLNPNNFYHSGWNEGTGIDGYLFDGWGIGQVQGSYDTGGASVWNMMPDGSSSFATANFDSVVVVLAGSDACTNAPVVSEGTYSGNNILATHDGTSSCDTSSSSHDVWFIYQASSNGVANARTGPGLGTDFDTVLTVFDGCGGNEIIANDDAYNDGFVGISEVSWVVTAGQMYWIRVAGLGGDTGNYALEIRVDPQPINDDCANALPATDGSYMGTTVGTTTEGILDCVNPETHDVWFVYTNPEDCAKDVTFSTCGGVTDFDTVLEVYNGCGGSFLGGNDDGCPGPNTHASSVTRTVAPGASVRIRLFGYGSATGNYEFNVSSVYSPSSFCAATMLHWALEEGSGTNTTEAVSGKTNVAYLVGPVVWTNGIAPQSSHSIYVEQTTPDSYIDAGALLTNGQYVAATNAGYRVLDKWTITAWVLLPNPQSTTGDRTIAGSPGASGSSWWNIFVRAAGDPNTLGFDFVSQRTYSGIAIPLATPVLLAVMADSTTDAFGPGEQHRFVMWDGNNFHFSDGAEYSSIQLNGLNLGAWNGGSTEFHGIIDDVRIFNRTLTQTELAILASQRPALAIAPAGAGSNTISWTPDLPGYVLQETPGLAPAAWTNSPSGATNPVTVTATNAATFYRLFKP